MTGPIKRSQELFLQIRFVGHLIVDQKSVWRNSWDEPLQKVFKTVKIQKWLFVKVMYYGYFPTKVEELESVPNAWNFFEYFDTMGGWKWSAVWIKSKWHVLLLKIEPFLHQVHA